MLIRFGTGFVAILALIITILILVFAYCGIVMVLWKWIMVGIFGLPMLNLWQTLGLCVLGDLLTSRVPIQPVFVKKKNKEDN